MSEKRTGERRETDVNIQGYQKVTLLDYPGKVGCTVFTGGCNLRCPFCHNGGLVRTPAAYPNAEGEVLDYLSSRRGILEGVCITGGEPLLQPDLVAFIQKIKDMGYGVKLDTNGALPVRLKKVLDTGLVDYVAMDLKSSPEGYPLATGCEVEFATFAESMEVIRESGVAFEFRTTAVKGIHTVADFEAMAKLVGNDPYFVQSFADSGNLLTQGWSAFSYEETEAIMAAVHAHAPQALLRGGSK